MTACVTPPPGAIRVRETTRIVAASITVSCCGKLATARYRFCGDQLQLLALPPSLTRMPLRSSETGS